MKEVLDYLVIPAATGDNSASMRAFIAADADIASSLPNHSGPSLRRVVITDRNRLDWHKDIANVLVDDPHSVQVGDVIWASVRSAEVNVSIARRYCSMSRE